MSNLFLDKYGQLRGWVIFTILIVLGFSLLGGCMYLAGKYAPADPCQPSREIHYECMPGGSLNP